jgi:RND family efflux transporter MFP subunit
LLARAPTEKPTDALAGVIMSRDSRLVTAEVDGRIDKLVVHHGQRVTAGTPLAIIDAADLGKQVDAARGTEEAALGELRRAESARAEAGRLFKQQRALLRDGAVSRDSVSSARSAYAIADATVETAEGAVRRARAAREQTEQLLTKTTITAPIDGVITLVKVSEGMVAGRGQPIARIFDPADLWVRFAVPPELRDHVQPGDRVTASPLRTGSQHVVAIVREVHRTLEPPLQFAVVEADLDDTALADHDAMLGAMVDVRLD